MRELYLYCLTLTLFWHKNWAGVEGIEPPLRVLETRVLPLNDTPR